MGWVWKHNFLAYTAAVNILLNIINKACVFLTIINKIFLLLLNVWLVCSWSVYISNPFSLICMLIGTPLSWFFQHTSYYNAWEVESTMNAIIYISPRIHSIINCQSCAISISTCSIVTNLFCSNILIFIPNFYKSHKI